MKVTFHIKDDTDREKLVAIVPDIPTGHFVKIMPNEGIRRIRANKYYFGAIIRPFAEYTGDTVKDLHDVMKRRHLHPLMQEIDEEYTEMILALRDLHSSGKEAQALYFMEYVYKNLTTTRLTTKDFNRYSSQVKRDAEGNGVRIMSRKEWIEKNG